MSGTQPGLGRRLRQLRLRRGLSQTDLAGDTLSPSAVSLLEAGRREPTARTLELLAQRLGCTVEYLRDGIHPDSGARGKLHLLRAELALRSGAVKKAAEALSDAADDGRTDRTINQRRTFIRALVAEEQGAYDDAIRLLTGLDGGESEGDEWLGMLIALARCYRRAGQPRRSVDVARSALARTAELGLSDGSEEAEIISTLILALYDAGEIAEAVANAREQLDAGPAPSRSTRALAYERASRQAEEQGRLTEAVWLAERGVALLTSTDDEAKVATLRTVSASLLQQTGQADPAAVTAALIEALDVLVEFGTPADVGRCEVELARAALRANDPERGGEWAERAQAHLEGVRPGLPIIWVRLVLAHSLLERDEPERAAAEVDAATSQLANVAPCLLTAEAWREAGELLRRMGRDTAALDAFSQALAVVGVGRM